MSAENETEEPDQAYGLKHGLPKPANQMTKSQLGRRRIIDLIGLWWGLRDAFRNRVIENSAAQVSTIRADKSSKIAASA